MAEFLLISYTGFALPENEAFEQAKNKLIISGTNQMIPKLESAVLGLKEGEEAEVFLEASEAFGEKDPALVRVVPLSAFEGQDVPIFPGQALSINNAFARVKSVSSGRVMADFNHPVAGKKVRYLLKLEKRLEKIGEVLKALAGDVGMDADVKEEEDGKVSFEVRNSGNLKRYAQGKDVLSDMARKLFPEIKEVSFKEV